MSITYRAHALIGCEVTGKLYKSVELPSCSHTNPPGKKFCGECGKKIELVKEERPIVGFDEDLGIVSIDGSALVVVYSGFAGDYDKRRAFAGVAVDADIYRDGYAGLFTGAAIDAPASKRILEPLGLWDPNTFGLWAILSCG